MNILGIVGSRRKLGNNEILVKEALSGARSEGASIKIVSLFDLYIEECNGCMACMLKQSPCRLQDDRDWLFQHLDEADSIIIAAPSYHGWVPGIISTIQYRVAYPGYRHFDIFKEDKGITRKAITLSASGGVAIAGNVIPALNVFVHRLGFEPLASFLAGSQGPGEVLLPEREVVMREVNQLGRDLVLDQSGKTDKLSEGTRKLRTWDWASHGYGDEKLHTVEDSCPFCFSQSVCNFSWFHTNPLPKGEVECAMCHYSRGKPTTDKEGRVLHNLKIKSDEEIISDWKWRRTVWHQESGSLWQKRKRELQEKRSAYGRFKPWWSVPEGRNANRPSIKTES